MPSAEAERAAAVAASTTIGSRTLAQRLLHGGSWALLGKGLTYPVGFGLAMVLARLLSPGDLGGYFLAMSVVGLVAALSQLGLSRAMVKLVASALATNRPLAARRALRVGILAVGLAGSVAATLLADGPGLWLTGLLQGGEQLQAALPWIALLAIAFAATEFSAEVLRGFHDLRGASLLADNLLQRLILLSLLTVVWVGTSPPRLDQVLLLALGAALAATAIGAMLIGRKIAALGHHGPSMRVREILRHGPPFLLLRLNFWLLAGAGVWVLGMFRPPEEVAVYGAANYLALLVLAPFTVVNAVLAPLVSELYSQGNMPMLDRVTRGAAAIGLLLTLPVTAALAGFGELVLSIVFGETYTQGRTILMALTLGRCIAIAFGSPAIALTMTDHQRDVLVVASTISLATLAGYVLLAPALGAEGVACVSALSFALQSAVLALVARRRLVIATWPEFSFAAFKRLVIELTRARRGKS
jgi:O-antigen/teichoic acid export membrane protein